jgi:hypothetical protein
MMLTLTVCSVSFLPRLVMLKATDLGAHILPNRGGILWLDGCLGIESRVASASPIVEQRVGTLVKPPCLGGGNAGRAPTL